jgi:hypothetical protein
VTVTTETEKKELKDTETIMEEAWELEAIKAKLPEEPEPIIQPKEHKTPEPKPLKEASIDGGKSFSRQGTNKNSGSRGTFEKDGWRTGNTGGNADVSDFGPEKKKEEKKPVKVGKLNAEDNAFLRKDNENDGPKRKTGRRVVRDSPFKKSETIKDDEKSPVSKNSGFKRQLTTGQKSGKTAFN